MHKNEIFIEIKSCLQKLYGDRLQSVLLFGSEAREKAIPNSDIYIMVILDGPVAFLLEHRRIIDVIYDLMLESGRVIDVTPVEKEKYEAGEFALYRNAKQEGVLLWTKKL